MVEPTPSEPGASIARAEAGGDIWYWGAKLTEPERAVVENRDPEPDALAARLARLERVAEGGREFLETGDERELVRALFALDEKEEA